MAQHPSASAVEELRQHYDDTELVCPSCGFEDERGTWSADRDGGQVRYSHECPSCGAARERTLGND